MFKEVFNVFMIISVIIGFSFIATMLSSKNGKAKSVIYLSFVVLFFVLNNLQIVVIDNLFTSANFFIRNLLLPFYLLIVPSFYTFLCYYLKIEKKVTSFVYFSIALFIIEIGIRVVLYFFHYNHDKDYFVARYSQVEEVVNAVFSLFLFIKCFITLYNQQKKYQYVASFDNLQWIKKFLFLGSVILLTWVFAIVFNLDKVINPQIFIYYPLRLSSSILLFWVGYQGFFNYTLLTERIDLRNTLALNKKDNNHDSLITNEVTFESSEYLEVKKYIIENKCYLNPTFSLENLAEELRMSTSKLSKIINKNSGNNFSDFINKLRIDKAKQLVNAPEFSHYTIISIGLECGFNSKSAFYTAFKKFTTMTPTEYKSQKNN